MQFIYPELLWALALLAVPIIIHLFYFRRFKKVYFSNVRFLKEIKEETSSRNKLKNFLILLMRLLAVAALIFAFAQPFLSSDDQQKVGAKGVSIYIDNSFSMSAESNEESILQLGKKKAIEISEAYGELDKIQILTSDFEGRHQRFVSQEEARGLIDEINSGPSARNISSVINRAKQAMKTESFDHQIIYVISDFQKSITDVFEADSNYTINFIPLQTIKESNVSIDSVYLESGVAMLNQSNTAKVVLHNYSSETAENVRLSMNNGTQEKPVGSFEIPAESTITVDASFSPNRTGWHESTMKITDYPIVFDDQYHFSYYVNEAVNILSLNQGTSNKYLSAAFENIPYFKLNNMSVNQIKYDELASNDLIVLNDLVKVSSGLTNELKQYVEAGGNVLIFPSVNADKNNYNDLLASLRSSQLDEYSTDKKEVKTINTNEFIFDGVYENRQASNLKLPISKGQYQLNSFQNTVQSTLLSYRDGTPYLLKNKLDKGYVYLSAAPLNRDINDLVNNAEIFVPMVYKMALSNAEGGKVAYTIGVDQVLYSDKTKQSAENNFKFTGASEFIPGQFNSGKRTILDVGNQIQQAGFYQLELNDTVEGLYAYNYDKKESSLNYNSPKDLTELFGDRANIYDETIEANFTQLISERETGISLWRWFLIAALLFLLLEQLFIRLLKN